MSVNDEQRNEEGLYGSIVVLAYACRRGSGSEPGAGWAMVQSAIEAFVSVRLITSELDEDTRSALQTSGVDITELRAVRLLPSQVHVQYIAWTLRARRKLSESAAKHDVDLVHHATYASDWMLPPLPPVRSGIPMLWGPVGGSTYPPITTLRHVSASTAGREIMRMIATRTIRAITLRWLHRRRVVGLALNTDSKRALSRHLPVEVQLNGDRPETRPVGPKKPGKRILYCGRLLESKGITIALRVQQELGPSWSLIVAGDGPERNNVVQHAQNYEGVQYLGHITRNEVFDLLTTVDVMLFPSLHDSAPWAVAEAAAYGVPIVYLEGGGIGDMAGSLGRPVSHHPSADLISRLADAVRSCKSPHELDRLVPLAVGSVSLGPAMKHHYERAVGLKSDSGRSDAAK